MKLKRIIFSDIIFSFIILLLCILSFISYQRINNFDEKANEIVHTNRVQLKLEQLLSYVKDAETGQRGFLLTNDSLHLSTYFESLEKQKETLDDIDSLIKDNPAQKESGIALRLLITQRLQSLKKAIDQGDTVRQQMVTLVMDGRTIMNRVRSLSNQMIRIEGNLLTHRTKQKNYEATLTPLYSLILSVIAIFAVAFTYFFLRSETRMRFDAEDSIKKLNEYFKDLPAAFSILKGPGHIHEMTNELYNEITGHTNLIGKSIKEVFPELKGQGFFEVLDKVYASGQLYIGKEQPLQIDRIKGKPGKRYFNFIYQPIYNNWHQTEGILIFGYEITEMIEARNKVEDSEQRSRLAIEAADIGTFDWDMENKIFISSARLVEIFGFKASDNVSHQQLIETFHPDDRPIRDKAVADSYAKGSLVYEARIIWPDGSVRWVNVYGKIIRDASGETLRMYGTAIDNTDRKVIMEELIKSEAQFRLLSDSMPQFVWTADVHGKLNYFSKSFYDYTGATAGNYSDIDWMSLVHPEEKEANIKKWHESVASGQEFIFEHRIKKSNGKYRWHLSRALPQKSSNGEIQRWVGTSTDIQEHKNIAGKLEQQVSDRTRELYELNKSLIIKNNIFAQAEENALIGSYAWNLQTGEMEYSDNVFRLFGYEPGAFVPSFEKFISMIHPDDKEQAIKDGEETMSEKMLVAHTYRLITRQGDIKHFRSTGKFITEVENLMLVGTVQDVSQDKLYNEMLQSKNFELERSNAELESFNYIASHDLQEPLRKIQAFSQRIVSKEGSNFSAFTTDYFNRIRNAAARMQSLIDALLSYSRTNASNLILHHTNLNMLMQEVILDLQEVTEEKKAIIKIEELPTINCVAIQVHQLFINLISNSIKYSKQGLDPLITISAAMVPGIDIGEKDANSNIKYWKINITDNGIGFEQQYENKIFELFQRLHGNSDYLGTGIGLAICKKIMRNHHGFISAVGKPDSGATFSVYFPAL